MDGWMEGGREGHTPNQALMVELRNPGAKLNEYKLGRY